MVDFIWLTIAFPLAGVLVNGIAGRRLGRRWNGLIGAGTVAAAFLVGVVAFAQLPALPEHARHVPLWAWITVGDFRVAASLLVDPLSMVMTLVVTGVGLLIHIYAIGYMEHDEANSRFFTYLNLFIASMLVLVLSDNFLGLYMGWELVGLCSYLLIGFWFFRPSAADAGKKAFIVNRVGDFGFAIGVFLIWTTFGTLDYARVFEAASTVPAGVITAITALLFVGAIGKSAQLPLYVWLPDAMEGPTPVSALIHAATMVTAGVYMVARSHALYALAPQTSLGVAVIGAVTAFYAATIALAQYDLKRILAYSTISQLGYMMLAVGVGAYVSGIFHLVTHAFFKALLFMAAGSVMHAMQDVIDVRRLGGLRGKMPVTYWTFVIGGLALAGFPLTAGFFSKDEILAKAFEANFLLYLLGLITALLTAFYTFRAIFLTFHGEPRETSLYEHAHENKPVMTVPLVILAALSLVGGLLGLPSALGLPHGLERWLSPVFEAAHAGGEHLAAGTEVALIVVSSLVAIGGIAAAWWVYVRNPRLADRAAQAAPWLYRALVNKYGVDELYNALFVKPGWMLGRLLAGVVDMGLIDTVLVDGSAKGVGLLGRLFARWQTGYLRNYVASIFIGALLISLYFFLR
ncbi:MAG: NADH-quinone oxidoreductase subunit L [Caldilineae bacterium]|nr:MAG: NADH-quinone oxidoreductase subunit L [Caldilineae bacterium]